MQKILISACLLGTPVRYNGKGFKTDHDILNAWQQEGRLVPLCPEVAGGLPTPRPPAELIGGDGHAVLNGKAIVRDNLGADVSAKFLSGARQALALCQEQQIRLAILTEKSPSCGSSQIYDGSFSGNRISGQGVTAALLEQHDIRVFNQNQIAQAADYLASLPDQAPGAQ